MCVLFFTRAREAYRLAEKDEYLDKAHEAHAEEQVQMAADEADQRVDGHLGLLLDLGVGERVVGEAQT